MIRKTLLLLAFYLSLFAQNMDIKETKDEKTKTNQYVYTIQLYSALALSPAKRFAKKLPRELVKKTYIVKIGRFYVVKYDAGKEFKKLKESLYLIKSLGYKDAFIIKMKKFRLANVIKVSDENLDEIEEKPKEEFKDEFEKIKEPSGGIVIPVSKSKDLKKKLLAKSDTDSNLVIVKKVSKKKTDKKRLSNSELILILSKADQFFNEGKYQKSLNEYLKIYESEDASETVLINISYLMGRTQNFDKFRDFLSEEKNKEPLLYAFGVGAIEISEEEIAKKFLLKNIDFSQEGYIELLLGYIFEKDKDLEKAIYFYKKAYLKNSKNPHFIYAYARALDLLRKYKEALEYYKKISEISDNKLKRVVLNRIIELKAVK